MNNGLLSPFEAGPGEKVLMPTVARTENTPLNALDLGKYFSFSGTFTQTFETVSSFPDGWYCLLQNDGVGEITLNPDASDLIDTLTSFIMHPEECRLVRCDGTKFTTTILVPFSRTYTATGSFAKPPGYTAFTGEIWNGGSSGRYGNAGATICNGGGGGGCCHFFAPSSMFGSSETITIGAGGAGISTAGAGNVGGASSIGTVVVMYVAPVAQAGSAAIPASSGLAAVSASPVGFEGASYAGSLGNIPMWGGGGAVDASATVGGNAIWGGASGGTGSSAGSSTAGGVSKYGGNGGPSASVGTTACDGIAPGGGGGGSRTGTTGAGARGECRIRGVV